jgi:hypothetical protein
MVTVATMSPVQGCAAVIEEVRTRCGAPRPQGAEGVGADGIRAVGGQDRGDATGGADSTGRDNRHRHEVEHHVEEGEQGAGAADMPAGLNTLGDDEVTPACSAATASVGEPICQAASAPPRCTRPMPPSKVSVRGSLTGHHPTDLACTSHQRERRLNRPVR